MFRNESRRRRRLSAADAADIFVYVFLPDRRQSPIGDVRSAKISARAKRSRFAADEPGILETKM
jgi:hypothetical protein